MSATTSESCDDSTNVESCMRRTVFTLVVCLACFAPVVDPVAGRPDA